MNSGSLTMSFSALSTGATYTPTLGVRKVTARVSDGAVQVLGYGTAAGQMNLLCRFDLPLTAGTTTTIDLYDGSLPDVFGQPAPFRTLRGFTAWVASGGDSTGVTIAPGTSNGSALWWGGTSPTKTIYPSGLPECGGSPAGVVIDATHRTVKFTNNGAADSAVSIILGGGTV